MSKKLSIAIPTYNRLSYLKECLSSIQNQTFQDFSIFVFDNASDEPVEQELKKMNDQRIHFIGSDKNVGFEGNANRILSYPFESEYVTPIFPDDDAMHPKMLELETSFLDAHKDAVFVVADLQRATDKTIHTFPKIVEHAIQSIIYKDSYEFVRAQMSWLRYGFPSAMYRLGAISEVRIRPEFFHFSDMVFLAEISKKGPGAFLAAPLMNHRIHAAQYSETMKKEYEQGALRMIPFFRAGLPVPLSKSDEKLLRTYSINFLLRTCAHINNGFFFSLRFIKKCRQQNLVRYGDLRYIDMRGIVSAISILFGSKKIIDTARWLRKSFQ